MFDTRKFGKYLAALRKKADMTQNELADALNVTRQAISKYEMGDSFPNVSILVIIAEVFHITLDELITSGNPTDAESRILKSVAIDGKNPAKVEHIEDVMNIAPLLKPSVLEKISSELAKEGIDIGNIVRLAEFLNADSTVKLLEHADFSSASEELIAELLPWMDVTAQFAVFQKILDGEIDNRLLKPLISHGAITASLIEAAVVEGVLPWEALEIQKEGLTERYQKHKSQKWV